MVHIKSENGEVVVKIIGTEETIATETAEAVLTMNNEFNKVPFGIRNHFWVNVSEKVNEKLMEDSKR